MGEKSFTPLDVRAVVMMMMMMMMMKKKKKKKHQVSLGCNSDRSERVLNIDPRVHSAREQKHHAQTFVRPSSKEERKKEKCKFPHERANAPANVSQTIIEEESM